MCVLEVFQKIFLVNIKNCVMFYGKIIEGDSRIYFKCFIFNFFKNVVSGRKSIEEKIILILGVDVKQRGGGGFFLVFVVILKFLLRKEYRFIWIFFIKVYFLDFEKKKF